MIQRIQSVYLLAAIVSIVLLYFLPLSFLVPGELSVSNETIRCGISGIYELKNGTSSQILSTTPLMMVVALSVILLTGAIFLYNNRKRQVTITLLGLVIFLAAVLFQVWTAKTLRGGLVPGHKYQFAVGWIFVLAVFVFGLMAVRGIRKDEALVRSADRLR